MECLIALAMVALFSATTQAAERVTGDAYISLSAADKSHKIWENCLENTTPAKWFSMFKMLGLFTENMCPSFTTKGDQLPYEGWWFGNRDKYIHTVGAVGRVEWRNRGQHPYTGIFQGATQGIVRLSIAADPGPRKLSIAPGMGLKFLRDNIDSANLVAMYSVSGQESWNFFKNDFSNHIPEFAGVVLKILSNKFAQGANNIRQVGISDWSLYGADGVKIANPHFPYQLRFHPTGKIKFSDKYIRPFTQDLTSIPEGSVLYEVYALDKPSELEGTEKHIADLVLVSDMITSLWGDSRLFFRHQDMATDLMMKPEWNRFTPQARGKQRSPEVKCH